MKLSHSWGNESLGKNAFTGGGLGNKAVGHFSAINGGEDNIASENCATVTGGYQNEARGLHSLVSGGKYNKVSGGYATVIGGHMNEAMGQFSSVLGGFDGKAIGLASLAAGGATAFGERSIAIGNGAVNTYVGNDDTTYSSIAIGYQATADEAHTISFGHDEGDIVGYEQEDDDEYVVAEYYDSPFYNRLVKIADGIDEHDAVTVGQLKEVKKEVDKIKKMEDEIQKLKEMNSKLMEMISKIMDK